MTEDEAEKLIETMFDEVKEVHVEMVNDKPRVTDEETVAQMDAQEMEDACADLVHSWRRFKEIDDRPGAAIDRWVTHRWLLRIAMRWSLPSPSRVRTTRIIHEAEGGANEKTQAR